MKCLIFAEFSLTGGTRAFLKDLLEIHKKHDLDSVLVFPRSLADPEMTSFISALGYSYIIIPDRRPLYNKSYFSLAYEFYYYRSIIKRVRPNLLVVSTATPGENISSFFYKIPLVYVTHTPVKKVTSKNKLMMRLPSLLAGKRKVIYAVSNYVKFSVQENWRIDSRFIEVIYNSFRLRNVQNDPGEKRVVLTLGHVTDYKNPKLWLQVAEKVTKLYNDVYFLWLGDGDLLSIFQKKCIDNRQIEFAGHKANVDAFYRNAYVYFQPSIKESLGISVLDAMSVGIPTIVSAAEGLPETTDHAISGYICSSNDVDEYAGYILSLLNDHNLRNQMGKSARERAEKYFSPAHQEKSLLSLYKRTAEMG
jgi:glycosyltransferase involved in cell wall biosynthesis